MANAVCAQGRVKFFNVMYLAWIQWFLNSIMSNNLRQRSEYQFELSARQLEAFLEIAAKQDRSFEELIDEALDRYIKKEVKICRKDQ